MKKDLIPIALLVLAAIFGFGFSTNNIHIPSVEELKHDLLGSVGHRWRWPEKIEEGKELLKNSVPLSYTVKGVNDLIVEKQIALAVLDTLTGEIFEKRVWIKQSDLDISKTKRFEGIDIELDRGYSPDRPVRIEILWWNSFNSIYRVEPTHYVVIANKYLVPSDIIPSIEEIEEDYTEIIYVPYSEGIHHSQLVNKGKEYLNNVVQQAFKELERDKVISRVNSDQLVIDSATEDLIKRIIVTEHIDPDLLAISDDEGKFLTERVYVIIGANKEKAYYYTSSVASARGISQFIRSTYNTIVNKYPEAGLIMDFKLGTSIHSNVIKAMVLLFDNNRKYLGSLLDTINEDEVELALAASYNGNPRWVRDSIVLYGDKWLDYQDISPILKPETFGYLKKLKALINLDFWR